MRKIIGLVALAFFSLACSEKEPEYQWTLNTSLSANQEYIEVLSKGMSIEGGYSIFKQAKYHSVSEIRIVSSPSFEEEVQFIYKPKENFIGTDVVVLKNCISAGGSGCNKTEYFKFIFNVTR